MRQEVVPVPLHDQVIIRRVDPTAISPGGIFIPQSAQSQQQEGEIIAVGPGKFAEFRLCVATPEDWPIGEEFMAKHARIEQFVIPMSVKPGDRVLFSKYAGADVKVRGKEYTILREDAIHCIFTTVDAPQELVSA
jgi:chaperonin GroES